MTNAPHSEKKRIRITYGSSSSSSKLASLPACHPFSEQLDVVFPYRADSGGESPGVDAGVDALLIALRVLETSYGKAKCTLEDVLCQAPGRFVNSKGESDLLAVSNNSVNAPGDDDVWCIDSRAHLTLSVCKETYEKLGLVGQKLPFGKSNSDRHVIDIPLQKNIQPVKVEARQKGNLKAWDKRRKETGVGEKAGLWDVLYTSNSDNLSDPGLTVDALFQEPTSIRVQCKKRDMRDIHVPVPSLALQPNPRPSSKKRKADDADGGKADTKDKEDDQMRKDKMDDWDAHIASLFEWVGMACLGAQRLQLYDRVDPYVALYEPPQPTDPATNSVFHLQWRGLLSPKFVKQVLDVILSNLRNPTPTTTPFVSMTCHAYTRSPVSYIPCTSDKNGGVSLQNPTGGVPKKLPRADGEDTWSLIVERAADGTRTGTTEPVVPKFRWCLAESIGQWDTRWG